MDRSDPRRGYTYPATSVVEIDVNPDWELWGKVAFPRIEVEPK